MLKKSKLPNRLVRGLQLIAFTLTAALLAGCAVNKSWVAKQRVLHNPTYKPVNVYTTSSLPEGTLRIVTLPITFTDNMVGAGGDAVREALRSQMRVALGKSNLFEEVSALPTDLLAQFGASELASYERLPVRLFDALADEFGADALLFFEITSFDAYRPMVMGVKARLVHMYTGETLWAIDDVFEAGDPRVAKAAMLFAKANNRQWYPQNDMESILRSPRAFARYVADAVFATLPNRQAPVDIVNVMEYTTPTDPRSVQPTFQENPASTIVPAALQ